MLVKISVFTVYLYETLFFLLEILVLSGGTAAAAPPPFRPGNPALCGSCPVTPYYCRLGDLLCYFLYAVFVLTFCVYACVLVFSVFSGLFSFVDFPSVEDSVGWVF